MSENKINGVPVTHDQMNRVLFLQEKKRRIQAESQLLVHEGRDVDAELEAILAEIESQASANDLGERKEGAA